ncbi:MAG TPA: arylamine N-acetyltransferase [Chryseosolibacter sp.]|nr:arylamine N-acetyltransferase [Chryseosolibacter sp.]
MDITKYLERINYTGVIDVNDDLLTKLHRMHVHEIPFENLDVYYKRPFDLSIENIYKKVVNNVRGGFCYELNLLFHCLLTEIGFSSRIIASRIVNQDGTVGPEFDHMSLCVKTGKEFLVDVGYGDLFVTPIEIKGDVQSDGQNYFKIDPWKKGEYIVSMSPDGADFSKRYTFTLEPVKAEDFHAICLDKQTNSDSYFVKNVICTRPTETGRVTIFNDKLIETIRGSRIETAIEGDRNFTRLLKEKFGIVIQ